MWLLLFAQEEPARERAADLAASWFDFAKTWGDTASVLGLLITMVGFPTIWWMQRKIKIESRKALGRVAHAFLNDSLEQITWQIHMTQESARLTMWQRAFDFCHGARQMLLRIQHNPHLTTGEKNRIGVEVDNLRQVEEYIERNKLGPNPPAVFQQDRKDALENAREFMTSIHIRLDAVRWEA